MHDLKINLVSLLALAFLMASCQSQKVFEMQNYKGVNSKTEDLHVIHVNSSRVQQECLFFDAEAENKWRHQYFMYVLNDKAETIEIMQSTNQDKETCIAQIKAIGAILKQEPVVRICIRGETKSDPKSADAVTFDSICNSSKCYGDNSAWVDTCPGFKKH